MKRLWWIVMVVFVTVGCQNLQNVRLTKLEEQSSTFVFRKDVGTVNQLILTSTQQAPVEKQREIASKLEEAVNSGEYNLTACETRYVDGQLAAATIWYLSGDGEGNNVRVKLLTSDEWLYTDEDRDIQQQLATAQRSTGNIIETKTIFQEEYLLSAEVWYLEK